MTSKTIHTLLVVLIVASVVALFGGTFAINKMMTKESSALVAQKAESQALEQEQVALRKAKKDIEKYAELEKIAAAIVPNDKNQAEAVRQIVNIASANNITLGSVDFPASTLGGSGASSGKAAAKGTKNTTLTQLTPVKSIPGVYQLPITVSNDAEQPVPYNRFIGFLDDLEHNRRTAQVSSIELQPDTKNSNLLNFTLTLNSYIKPEKKS